MGLLVCACANIICLARLARLACSAPFRYFQRAFAGFQMGDRHLFVISFGEG